MSADDHEVYVAIIDKSRLKYWKHYLKEHSIEADIILPTTLAIPMIEDTWQAYSYQGPMRDTHRFI